MKRIELNHIFMNYNTPENFTEAVKDVSFIVNEGEFVTLVGASGSGKTTILNIIAGLLSPSFGEVKINGKIGYMFQKDELFEWLTLWDNLLLGPKIQKNLTPDKINKIDAMIKNYNLYDFKNHKPSELSGGMRQKAALIRTLSVEPDILLLDEPFSALDYQTRLNVGDEIFNIIKKENKTVLMITHDISEAIASSDRIIVLSSRPAEVLLDININFNKDFNSPLKRREAPEFKEYFNIIWKELNK